MVQVHVHQSFVPKDCAIGATQAVLLLLLLVPACAGHATLLGLVTGRREGRIVAMRAPWVKQCSRPVMGARGGAGWGPSTPRARCQRRRHRMALCFH
jgi:hypothetical protein